MSSPPVAAEPGLDLLRQLYPPKLLVHVGIGHGAGPMQCWRHWSVPADAVLIDADASRVQWAKALAAEHPHWHLIENVLLDQVDGQALYHRASNPDEDGLLDPEALKGFWPNLHKLEQAERPAQRLDNLLSELTFGCSSQASSCSWLLIDCLPADRILRGAKDLLQRTTVVWARVLLQPIAQDADDATLSAVEVQLQPLGFRCVQVSESNHPAVGYGLFVRDWAAQLRDEASKAAEYHKAEAEKQAKLAAGLEQQLEAAKAETRQQQAQAAERQSELDKALEAAKADAEQQKTAAAQHKAEAEKQAALAQQHKADAEQQKTAAAQHKAEAEKQAALAQQHKAEAEKQAALAQQHKAEADKQAKLAQQHKAEVDKQAKLVAERGQQLEQSTQAQQQAQAKVDQLNKTLAQRTQTQEEAEAKASELTKALEAAKAEANQQAKLAAERAEQLAQRDDAYAALQRDNAIALRMQSLREADLKDLQQRHAEVVEQKDKQAKLLKELTERLTVASGYLHQLEQQPKDAAAEAAVNYLTQPEPGGSRPDQAPSRPSRRWWPFGKAE